MKKLGIIISLIMLVQLNVVANNDVEMGNNYYKKVVAKYIKEIDLTNILKKIFYDLNKENK